MSDEMCNKFKCKNFLKDGNHYKFVRERLFFWGGKIITCRKKNANLSLRFPPFPQTSRKGSLTTIECMLGSCTHSQMPLMRSVFIHSNAFPSNNGPNKFHQNDRSLNLRLRTARKGSIGGIPRNRSF